MVATPRRTRSGILFVYFKCIFGITEKLRHFEATAHTFCLQIGGERVWDYAGDNYVHRLIQADESGKMVEYQRGGMVEFFPHFEIKVYYLVLE